MKPQKQVPDIHELADRHLWQIQPFRDFAWIFLLLLLFWLGYQMRAVTVPLLVAVLLAYLFAPMVSLLERRLKFLVRFPPLRFWGSVECRYSWWRC